MLLASETFSFPDGLAECCECVAKTPISTKRTKAISCECTRRSVVVYLHYHQTMSVTTLVKRSRTSLRIDMDGMLVLRALFGYATVSILSFIRMIDMCLLTIFAIGFCVMCKQQISKPTSKQAND